MAVPAGHRFEENGPRVVVVSDALWPAELHAQECSLGPHHPELIRSAHVTCDLRRGGMVVARIAIVPPFPVTPRALHAESWGRAPSRVGASPNCGSDPAADGTGGQWSTPTSRTPWHAASSGGCPRGLV